MNQAGTWEAKHEEILGTSLVRELQAAAPPDETCGSKGHGVNHMIITFSYRGSVEETAS